MSVHSKTKKVDRETGKFGEFGGRYVPELLVPVLEELE